MSSANQCEIDNPIIPYLTWQSSVVHNIGGAKFRRYKRLVFTRALTLRVYIYIFWYIDTIATVFRAANLSCLPCAQFKSQQVLVKLLRSISAIWQGPCPHINWNSQSSWVALMRIPPCIVSYHPPAQVEYGEGQCKRHGRSVQKQPQLQLWKAQAVSRTKMPARTGQDQITRNVGQPKRSRNITQAIPSDNLSPLLLLLF